MEKYLDNSNAIDIPIVENQICSMRMRENVQNNGQQKELLENHKEACCGQTIAICSSVDDGPIPCKSTKKESQDFKSSTEPQTHTISHWDSQNLNNSCRVSCTTSESLTNTMDIVQSDNEKHISVCSITRTTPSYNNIANTENRSVNIFQNIPICFNTPIETSGMVSSGETSNVAVVSKDTMSFISPLICSPSPRKDISPTTDTSGNFPKHTTSSPGKEIHQSSTSLSLVTFGQSEPVLTATDFGLTVSKDKDNCSFRSIHRSDFRDQTAASPIMQVSNLDSWQKENPIGILNGMQGIGAVADHTASQGTFPSMYSQQHDNNIILVTQPSHHLEPLKVLQAGNQIVHTPHPKHGRVIYYHNALNSSLSPQMKTTVNGPHLKCSGDENTSPPDNLSDQSSSFNTTNNGDGNPLPYMRSDPAISKDDDPIRHQHNLNERKRRARITIACDLMRRLVPGLSDKTDKATVFEYAARYIYFLQNHVGTDYDRNFLVKYSPY